MLPAGDSLDEAVTDAGEAAAAWIDAALDAGNVVPAPSNLAAIHDDPACSGWRFGVIMVDPALLDDTIERVNVTPPLRVLERPDARARAAGDGRSGLIASLAIG